MSAENLTLPSGRTEPAEGIRGACRLRGGLKVVAKRSGILPSNLSHWLSGKSAISSANIAKVMEVLDLPDGEPRKDKVIVWTFAKPWNDMKQALRLYFPKGASIAKTPWSKPGLTNAAKLLKQLYGKTQDPPEIYLLKGGGVRAVFRQRPGFLLYTDMMGEGFEFRSGKESGSEIDITADKEAWFDSSISIEMFDRAFDSKSRGLDEIIELAFSKGIGPDELYRMVEER